MTKTRIGPTATPYSPGLDLGDWVFLAGQSGTDPATKELPEGIEAQTEQALRSVETLLQEAGLSLGDVAPASSTSATYRSSTATTRSGSASSRASRGRFEPPSARRSSTRC